MRKALFALALVAGPVQAQQAQCFPRDEVVSRLAEEYGEAVRMRGLDGAGRMIELFASEEAGTWTITFTVADGMTCMVAAGESFEAVPAPIPGALN